MTDMELFDQLNKKLRTYHPAQNFPMVEKAYKLAKSAHEHQLRKSGEPYIIHPLAVALVLSELEMDIETIVAGILHDVIEDTAYSYDQISQMFSEEIAQLVDGVTKLEAIEYSSHEEEQAENYRKMFMAMARDIRVLIIKIADRLHNLRTLKHMSFAKQKEKAQETLDIYAPLAGRLGISKVKNELEDLAFYYLNPEGYQELKLKIQRKQSERIAYVERIVEELRAKLIEHNISGVVEGRPKHFFSIYKKMVSQHKDFEQIYDIFAVRVIVDSVINCYEVLGIVHEIYTPIPGRFKDYIALPKPNFYQSLHNTLIGPEGEPFEVQIRTAQMHKTAEFGIAAHWKYKQGQDGRSTSQAEEEKLSWLKQILEWQRDLSDNREYLDAIKLDLNVFMDQVFCFTPKGEVVSLTAGATPIDFAYAIHSAVGNKMVGAKVDNRIVTLDYELKTGERVEILTSQNARGPSLDWLKIVKTSQARNKINQWFKKENKEENIIKGREMLERAAKKMDLSLVELLTPHGISLILNRFSMRDWDSVCAAVGHGSLRERQVLNRLQEEYLNSKEQLTDEEILRQLNETTPPKPGSKTSKSDSGVIVKGIGGLTVRFSKCCSPVPGDEIVAFVTRGRGVSVHRTDCSNIIHINDLEKHRLMDAEWTKVDHRAEFRADLHILCDDRKGLLADVSNVLHNDKIDVKSVNLRTAKTGAIFDVSIAISGKEQLERVIGHLLKVAGVHDIERIST